MRKRRFATAPCLLLGLAGIPSSLQAQACGVPWTVTAAFAGYQRVAVHVCGTISVPCVLRNPRITVEQDEIRVVYTKRCTCLGIGVPFSDAVIVDGVPPGTYTIGVAVSDCGEETIVGSTTFTLDQTELIPTLDPRGIAALALLLAVAALWRLRF